MFMPSFTNTRPASNKSQAHPGIQPLSPLTHTQRFEPLPTPIGLPPYHFDLESVVPGVGKVAAQNGKLVFHTVGDVGGIKNPEYQMAVADAMKKDLDADPTQRPSFYYIIGDVVYYTGDYNDYYDQFYEPYDHYNAPVFSIPGNHDGEIGDPTVPSLQGWVSYFMTKTAHVDPISRDAPRMTLTLPNVYYTLTCPFATLVGMYTNVPEGGSIDSIQQQWLTNEFASAPTDKALVVSLHHPVYSFDDHHSGSARMADAVQHAINDSRRVPNLVLTGHVHNYQRIERSLVDGGAPTPFIVAGHGGYYHLHGMNAGNGTVDEQTQAKLVASNDQLHGYLTITIDAQNVSGAMTTVDHTASSAQPNVDTFSYPAAAQFLKDGVTISL